MKKDFSEIGSYRELMSRCSRKDVFHLGDGSYIKETSSGDKLFDADGNFLNYSSSEI